jgi:glycosyltransferase involved in cell wall biosynthesis
MKVLHLASFDRWSGAAAPAFTEVEALRSAGVEAYFGYVGGYRLEAKLAGVPYAFPVIARGQSPRATLSSVRAIRDLCRRLEIDLLHAHLTYDHQLAFLTRKRTVRTFHARRPIRNDPLTRFLLGRTRAIAVINSSLANAPTLQQRRVFVTPPPVDHRIFHPGDPPGGASVSSRPGGASAASRPPGGGEPRIGVIGKIAPDRGFEDALRTLALIPEATLMIIGKGPHQPSLEKLAGDLGIENRLTWAGYHEDGELAALYRTLDLLLFTAKGSDEGHRAISEAMACGVPVAAYPLEGVEEVVGAELGPLSVATAADPAALAATARGVLGRLDGRLREQAVAATGRFSFRESSRRLMEMYQSAG